MLHEDKYTLCAVKKTTKMKYEASLSHFQKFAAGESRSFHMMMDGRATCVSWNSKTDES